MTGHIRRRGTGTWELKFDIGTDPITGRRKTKYHSFKGTKREAEAELTRLKAGADRGEYVDPARITISEFLKRWKEWAPTQVAPKTFERYAELMDLHVTPHLGAGRLQKLTTLSIAELYGTLSKPVAQGGRGLAPMTVGHVHRVFHGALEQAVTWSLLTANPAAKAEPPRVEAKELEIPTPEAATHLVRSLKDESDEMYIAAVIVLASGIRRGELAALRFDRIDFSTGRVRIIETIEQTKVGGLRVKPPKSKAGRRVLSVPPNVVAELKRWRAKLQQRHLALGMGRLPDDALVLPREDFEIYPPDALTSYMAFTIGRLKLPKITLQMLRHTHVSQLIAMGLDVITVSKRIGHSKPTVTLNVYGHLFGDADGRAAAAVERAMAQMLTD